MTVFVCPYSAAMHSRIGVFKREVEFEMQIRVSSWVCRFEFGPPRPFPLTRNTPVIGRSHLLSAS